jgi:hypothetical protein
MRKNRLRFVGDSKITGVPGARENLRSDRVPSGGWVSNP